MDSPTSEHPSIELLTAFAQGRITDQELTAVEAHLDRCPSCCSQLAQSSEGDPFLSSLKAAARRAERPSGDARERRLALRALQQAVGSKSNGAAAASRTFPPPPVPERIDHYQILGMVGRGGMGVVYKARDERLHRLVALKMIIAGEFASPEQHLRFRLEAELAARVQHPQVVQVHEVGEYQGRPFLALEWIDGGTLRDSLRGAAPTPREAAVLVELLARAVHAAHCKGVVHRDLKPGNILLASDSRASDAAGEPTALPKITDFGLACLVQEDSALTATGVTVGTPEYMAPEQASGQQRDVGPAADQYALGAILYEMLAGRPPFREASAFETLKHVLESEPRPPHQFRGNIPSDLETICLKCLQKDPGQRYATSEKLADDLGRFLRGEPIRARPVGALERFGKWTRRRPTVAALLAAVSVAVLAGAGVSAYFAVQAVYQAEQAELAKDQALHAAASEASLRRAADVRLYGARMAMAMQAWSESDVKRAQELLDSCLPTEGRTDLRGWEWHYVHRLCHSQRLRLPGHDGPVFDVVYSPDGKYLASSGGGNLFFRSHPEIRPGQVFVRRAQDGAPVFVFRDFPHLVTALGVSVDGALLAAGGMDGSIDVWELPGGAKVAHFSTGPGAVTFLAFDSAARLLSASGKAKQGDGTGAIQRWDPRSGQRNGDPLALNAAAEAYALTRDGTRLAYAANHKVHCFDLTAGTELWCNGDQTADLGALAWSPAGGSLASAAKDGRVHLLDATTGRLAARLLSGEGPLQAVCFSPDGRLVAAAGNKPEVRIWDVVDGDLRRTIHGPTDSIGALSFSPDGASLVTGDLAGVVNVWDATVDQRGLLHKVGGYSARSEMRFAAGGRELLETWGKGWRLDVIDTQSGKAVTRELAVADPLARDYFTCAASPDGRWLAGILNSQAEALTLWNTQTLERRLLAGAPGPVSALRFGRDNGWFASSHLERENVPGSDARFRYQVAIWDVPEGTRRKTILACPFQSYRTPPRLENGAALAISPDGNLLAHAGYGQKIRIWDWQNDREVAMLGDEGAWHRSLTWSGDGRLLAGQVYGKFLIVWNVADWSERFRIPLAVGERGLALSPDGKRLASSDMRGTIRLWETDLGTPVFELRGLGAAYGTAGIRAQVAFDETGLRLASFNNDDTTNIYDAAPRGN